MRTFFSVLTLLGTCIGALLFHVPISVAQPAISTQQATRMTITAKKNQLTQIKNEFSNFVSANTDALELMRGYYGRLHNQLQAAESTSDSGQLTSLLIDAKQVVNQDGNNATTALGRVNASTNPNWAQLELLYIQTFVPAYNQLSTSSIYIQAGYTATQYETMIEQIKTDFEEVKTQYADIQDAMIPPGNTGLTGAAYGDYVVGRIQQLQGGSPVGSQGSFNQNFFFPTWNAKDGTDGATAQNAGATTVRGVAGQNNDGASFFTLVLRGTKLILRITAPIVAIALLFVGVRLIIGSGDDESISAAKDYFRYLVIGLLVMTISYTLIQSIVNIFTQ